MAFAQHPFHHRRQRNLTPPWADTDARLRLGAVRLPALPEILLKLMQLYRRDDAAMSDFVALIAQDAAMASKVMAVANSAAYRSRGPQQGLDRALSLLGTEMVKTLVISQSIFQAFYDIPQLRRIDLGPFWQHAMLAAAVAREAARHLGYPREDEAYLAGLLHDIGRLGLLAAAPELVADDFLGPDDRASCDTERRQLQVSHAEAGAWLIDRWRLDDYVADSVRYHHEPLPRLAATHPLIRIVAFAHWAAELPPDAPWVIEAGALCGMTAVQVAEVAAQARAKLAVSAEQLGLPLQAAGHPGRTPAAADRLRDELAPMMLAATVLKELPVQAAEAERLQRLADAARIVFQFSEVVVMVPDAQAPLLRWVGAALPGAQAALPAQWLEFTLPNAAGTRLGDGLAARRPVYIARADATPALSVAEDQLLRLLGTEQLVCLPLSPQPPATGMAAGPAAVAPPRGALVCVGDAALVNGLRTRQAFLSAFMAQAEAVQARAWRSAASAERALADQTAQQLDAARNLAHEVNNPLSIIQNYLALLHTRLGAGAGAAEAAVIGADIAVLQEEVARVGRLVQALAAPAAVSVTPTGAVDVNRLIADVVRLTRQAPGGEAGIEVLGHGHDGSPLALADRDQLEQVLVNLVKNALEALAATPADGRGPGGRIVVANNGLVNRDGRLMLELSVRDDGPGLPAELLPRLFAPALHAGQGDAAAVHSSKPGADRGRGLAIVHRLVTGMGGLIQCRSSAIGTSFDIFLPQRPPVAAEPGSSAFQGNAGPPQVSLTPPGGGPGPAQPWGRS